MRIVDLSTMMSGPWSTSLLGDLGADVIKVEVPGKGDHVRTLPNRHNDMAAMFLNANRSKRSVTVDLKSPDGVSVLKRLVENADVLVQNFRPGVVERLGVGYEDLTQLNPRLIYLSLSGAGERGPAAKQRFYDPIIQCITGLTTVQAGSDEERPRLIRTVLPDKLTAIVGAQAILAALYAREKTGEGQHIRLSMVEAMMSFIWASDMGSCTFVGNEKPVSEGGSFLDLIYQAKDGWMTVGVNTNQEWQTLCDALGHSEWKQDERFTTPAGRSKYINERLEMTQNALREKTVAEWLDILERFDVPAAPCLTRSDVIKHPTVLNTEVIIESDHPQAGRIRQARYPARFSATPVGAPQGAPLLGVNNAEVLREAGYTEDQIRELQAHGVVGSENA